jgi:hypothetical protein
MDPLLLQLEKLRADAEMPEEDDVSETRPYPVDQNILPFNSCGEKQQDILFRDRGVVVHRNGSSIPTRFFYDSESDGDSELYTGNRRAPLVPCVTPQVWVNVSCCTYDFPNQLENKTQIYYQPRHVFSNASDTDAWAATLKPTQPFYYPFWDQVELAGGWLYNKGDFHSGIKPLFTHTDWH